MSAESDKQRSLPDWAAVFRTAARARQFERTLADYFEAQGVEVVIEDGWVIPQNAEQKDLRWGLSNLAALCAGAEDEEWAELIAGHFSTVRAAFDADADIDTETMTPEEVRKLLVLRLWEQGAFEEGALSLVRRSDIPGLMTVLCLEMPNSIRNVTDTECERLGDKDELFAVALRNVERVAEPEVAELELPEGDGASITLISGDSFLVASLALVIGERFPSLFRHEGAFVSLPDRHTILAMPLSTPKVLTAISRLITLTHQAAVESPGAISPRVWWTDGRGRWIELPYQIEDGNLSVNAPPELGEIFGRLG